jgi:hypothetical protein
VLQLFVQTYHRLLSAFGTSITNAYSTHFVKSSGLNAKAKFHYIFTSAGFYWGGVSQLRVSTLSTRYVVIIKQLLSFT